MDPAQRNHLRRSPWMMPAWCGGRTTPTGGRWYECVHPGCTREAKACGGYCSPCFQRIMDEAGQSATVRLGRELVRASRHWFPDVHNRGEWPTVLHFALGLAGETGEVVDVIKKADICGGFTDSCELHPDGKHSVEALTLEIGDLLTYLLELCAVLGIDPEAATHACQRKCAARWGEVPPRPPAEEATR